MLVFALLLLSFVLLLLAAIGWPATPRVSLGWLGVAVYVFAQLWPALQSKL